jgi:hypothetical protein
MFQSVVLADRKSENHTKCLISRILSNDDTTIAGHVCHLQIGPFKDDEVFHRRISGSLKQVLLALHGLQSLRYLILVWNHVLNSHDSQLENKYSHSKGNIGGLSQNMSIRTALCSQSSTRL